MENTSTDFDGPGYVVLRCLHCKKDIARTDYPPYKWVHLDDEVIVTNTEIMKNWSHEAEPDVIDVGGLSQEPAAPPSVGRLRRSNPFY